MLTTHDIGNLFKTMNAAYGGQWKHGTDAMDVWRNALAKHTSDQLHDAANAAIRKHVAHPPTLPEFLRIIAQPPPVRSSTYLPPPETSQAKRAANLVIIKVLVRLGGVDNDVLRLMYGLSRQLITELSNQKPTREWCEKVERKFLRLARTQAGDPDHGTG